MWITWPVQPDEPMAPTATQIATCDKWFRPTTQFGRCLTWTTQGRGNALANHKETQEQMVEKTPNPQWGSYGTTLRTRALGFSIFWVQFVVRVSTWCTRDIYTRNIPPSWAGGLTNKPISKIQELEHFTGCSDRTSLNYSVLEQSLQKYSNLIAGLSKVLEIDAIGK